MFHDANLMKHPVQFTSCRSRSAKRSSSESIVSL